MLTRLCACRCPPCRFFTPKLAEFYKSLRRDHKAGEVVFISSDQDETAFDSYHATMPWLAVPFQDEARRQALQAAFKVKGLPTLIVLDAEGRLITDDGRSKVDSDPEGDAFPWDGSSILMRTASVKHPALMKSSLLDDRVRDISVSEDKLEAFRCAPLAVLGDLSQYCLNLSRQEAGLPGVSDAIPFDVSKHDQSRSEVARSMMSRLRDDVMHFANQHNQGSHPRLPFLLTDHIDTCVADPSSTLLSQAIDKLSGLITDLESLREADYLCLNSTLPLLSSIANTVPLPDKSKADMSESDLAAYSFYLRRYTGGEVHLWHEYLFGALLSSAHEEDLMKLNPYLTPDGIIQICDLVGSVLLHANRIGQINRSLLDARHLLKLLDNWRSKQQSPPGKIEIHLKQGGEALARSLAAERHYMSFGTGFDPRFLVFEFCWNITLRHGYFLYLSLLCMVSVTPIAPCLNVLCPVFPIRKKQVEMVTDFVSAIRNGESMVKQMIMGAGDTHVTPYPPH